VTPIVPGLTVRRVLDAPRLLVFEAWTRPDLMARWFFPEQGWSSRVTADVRVGGRYELRMIDTEGKVHLQFGEYREIVAGSRLVFTWSCPDLAVESSVVTLELVDHGAKTELMLTHELPPDPTVRGEHEHGWHGCLAQLEGFLSRSEEGGIR